MSKAPKRPNKAERGLRREYSFDYRNSRPNRFASVSGEKTLAVVLEPDVARVFSSSRSVNEFLRSVISALPQRTTNARGNRRKAG